MKNLILWIFKKTAEKNISNKGYQFLQQDNDAIHAKRNTVFTDEKPSFKTKAEMLS